MKLYKSVEEITKSIGNIERTAGRLQDTIHRTAVSVLKLFHDGEIDGLVASELLTNVQEASPYHRASFAKWVETVTPFEWSNDTKRWFGKKNDKITGKEFMYARDNAFFDIAPAPEVKPYNLIEALQREVTKAEKRRDDKSKGHEEDVIPQEALRMLRGLLANVAA